MAVCSVYCVGERAVLATAADALEAAGMSVVRAAKGLTVGDGGPVVLTVTRARGAAVLGRAIALGARTPFEADMRSYDARLEIRIPDLAAALDESNTLMMVQGALADLTGGVLHNGWNGQLYRPQVG